MLLIFLPATVVSYINGEILTAVIFTLFTLISLLFVTASVLTSKSDTAGCLMSSNQWVSILLWVAVVGSAIYAVKVEAINGWLCAAIILAAHFIAYIIGQIAEPKSPENKPISNNKTDLNTITEEYYDLVTKAAEDVYNDYERVLKLCKNDPSLDIKDVNLTLDESLIMNANEKIRLLFILDIIRCYKGLEHNIDLDSKDGFGLFYFTALVTGCSPKKPYADLSTIKAEYMAEVERLTKTVMPNVDAASIPHEMFLISKLLASKDTKLHRKFLVDIYRFSSIIAKADNTVTDEEANWLSSILISQEKEDKEIVAHEEEPTLPPISVDMSRLDPMFADAARYVVMKQDGSTSRLQRAFEIGYNRAGRLSDPHGRV